MPKTEQDMAITLEERQLLLEAEGYEKEVSLAIFLAMMVATAAAGLVGNSDLALQLAYAALTCPVAIVASLIIRPMTRAYWVYWGWPCRGKRT